MASTATLGGTKFIGGITTLPGLQVSPFGAQFTTMKAYSFTLSTQTTALTATGGVEVAVTVNGLTTADIPFACYGATGPWTAAGSSDVQVCTHLRVSAANTLQMQFARVGTSTGSVGTTATGGAAMTLFTLSYAGQSSSTTT